MTTQNLMALVDAYADAECDYRMSGRATSCQEEYAADMAKAALLAAIEAQAAEIERLRINANNIMRESFIKEQAAMQQESYGGAAARLQGERINQGMLALLRRYRTETPLGHQPHMIAEQVDAAIAAAAEKEQA